ncbi:hypothetical protein BH10BAC2_BH10BAC2_18100 [soil metagenome]
MSLYQVHILLNLSVLLAAAAVIWRIRFIPAYLYPFCMLLWIAAFNELLSLYLIADGMHNAVNGNIYILIEFFLLSRQFFNWGSLTKSKYLVLIITGILTWVADNFLFSYISSNNSLSRIIFAFLFVFLSVDMINRHIVFGKERPYTASTLYITIGLLLFFACKAYVEVFNAFNLGFSTAFYANIWFTLSVVNAVANIVYTTAMLCIPRKQEFLLPL